MPYTIQIHTCVLKSNEWKYGSEYDIDEQLYC